MQRGFTTSVSFCKGSLPSAQVSQSQTANAEIIFYQPWFNIVNKILHILHMHKLSLFSGKQLWIICHIHHSSDEIGKKYETNENGGDYFFAVQLFNKWPNLGDRAAEQRAKKPIRKFLQ